VVSVVVVATDEVVLGVVFVVVSSTLDLVAIEVVVDKVVSFRLDVVEIILDCVSELPETVSDDSMVVASVDLVVISELISLGSDAELD